MGLGEGKDDDRVANLEGIVTAGHEDVLGANDGTYQGPPGELYVSQWLSDQSRVASNLEFEDLGAPVFNRGHAGAATRLDESSDSVRDEAALARLLGRAETEPGFLDTLERHGKNLKSMFRPAYEQAALKRIVKSVSS